MFSTPHTYLFEQLSALVTFIRETDMRRVKNNNNKNHCLDRMDEYHWP